MVMLANIRVARRTTRHHYTDAMGDGSTLSNKSVVRLYGRQGGVLAEGRPLGGNLDSTGAEVRFANGRIPPRQSLDNPLVSDAGGFAYWAAYTQTVPHCGAVVRRGIQRIDENDRSHDHCISCWSWDVGFRAPI